MHEKVKFAVISIHERPLHAEPVRPWVIHWYLVCVCVQTQKYTRDQLIEQFAGIRCDAHPWTWMMALSFHRMVTLVGREQLFVSAVVNYVLFLVLGMVFLVFGWWCAWISSSSTLWIVSSDSVNCISNNIIVIGSISLTHYIRIWKNLF